MEGWGSVRDNLQSKPVDVDFSVDLIRAVAIVLVIFVHANNAPYTFSGSSMPVAIANWWTLDVYRSVGYFGVPLFVMLTGILLLDPNKCDEPLSVFFKKRFARIGLPMIFWTAAYFAWSYYFNGIPLTTNGIVEGLLGGSYFHLGFLYILIGLYLATPILRIVVKYIDRQRFAYFLGLVDCRQLRGSIHTTVHELQHQPSAVRFHGLGRLPALRRVLNGNQSAFLATLCRYRLRCLRCRNRRLGSNTLHATIQRVLPRIHPLHHNSSGRLHCSYFCSTSPKTDLIATPNSIKDCIGSAKTHSPFIFSTS